MSPDRMTGGTGRPTGIFGRWATGALTLMGAATLLAFTPEPALWGEDGHVMSARAAARILPTEMPRFFRKAEAQLAYLNPEPDRWRMGQFPEMDEAFSYDHYIDLENVPSSAREAGDRYEYLRILYRETELERPERDAGFLPFHIMELYQRIVTEWALWYEAATPRERAWIEERILNDAGTLGHYVTDGAQPHHTTIHFNGWNASSGADVPNPGGFTTSGDFHWRFESLFVRAHVPGTLVLDAVDGEARYLGDMEDVRAAVWDHVYEANDQVETLYRLERDHGFDPDGVPAPETVDFAVNRLASGARLLADLWWTAHQAGRELAAAADTGDGSSP